MKEPARPYGRHGSILSYTKGGTEPETRAPEDDRQAAAPEWQPLIHPAKVLNGILRSPRLIAAATISGALLGVLVALSTPKFYAAYTDLLVDPREIRLLENELVSASLPFDAALAIIENQMRLITSSRVVDRLVEELDLTSDAEFNGRDGEVGLRSLIARLRSLLSGDSTAESEARLQAVTARNLLENISVSRSGRTFVVTVAAQSRSPEKSAAIANKMVEIYLEESSALLGTVAGRAAAELGARLEELRSGVEEAERAVEEFRAGTGLVDARGYLIGDDEIIALNQQLAAARGRTIEAEVRVRSLQAADANDVLNGGLPEGVSSGVITELRAQYAALTREASRLAASVGPRHPQRRSIESQLTEARGQIRAELDRITSSIRLELDRARAEQQALSARLEELKERQAKVGADMVKLRDLERAAAAKRAVYEAFLLRATETGEQQGLNATNISVISEARIPLDPTGKSRSFIAIAGTILGFLFGITLAALRGALDGWRPSGRLPGGNGPESPRGRSWRHAGSDERISPVSPSDAPGQHGAQYPGASASASEARAGSPVADPASAASRNKPGPADLEEIREGLREVRSALYDLAEMRARRSA